MPSRFTYNQETCKFEPIHPTIGRTVKRFGIRLIFASVIAGAAFVWFNQRFHSVAEQWLAEKNVVLKAEWHALDLQADAMRRDLQTITDKEDQVYRVILDSQPLSKEQRLAGSGGREFSYLDNIRYNYLKSTLEKIEKFSQQLGIEEQSMNQVETIMNEQEIMWLSRPAIQPINNKQLILLHTTFGMRPHPKYGFMRPHKGLDFTATVGTPVFATGDGLIFRANWSDSYGNVIYINHGYGYQTRYAHLSKILVKKGEKIRRGQIIGYVGSTGSDSTGPHLHYEVRYYDEPLNPINFFQRDLNNEEFQKLIEITNDSTPPLD